MQTSDTPLERARELVRKQLENGEALGTDELIERLGGEIEAQEVSPVVLRRAAWSLVDAGQAELTPEHRLRAVG